MTIMPTDGETAPRLGEQFRLRCKVLIKNLGYAERIDRKCGLDLGVDPSLPTRNVRRPLFSPNGRTAIEFKEGLSVQVVKEAKTLEDKIVTLNRNENAEFSGIVGGIILTDVKVGNTNLRRALEHGVFCWDSRYAHFLARKIAIFQELLRTNNDLREEQLDDWTTFFMIFQPFDGFLQVKAYLFYHNSMRELTAEVAETLLARFSQIIREYDSMKVTIVIHLQLHSIAEVTEGGEQRFNELTSGNITTYAKYEHQQCWVIGYHLAPWFVYCREHQ